MEAITQAARVAPGALVESFARLAEHTRPACGACRAPYRCCSRPSCEEAMRFALEAFGLALAPTGHPSLPLMGEGGCTAAPHLRPLCSAHACEQHLTAPAPGSPDHAARTAWIEGYWRLREEAGEQMEAVLGEPGA